MMMMLAAGRSSDGGAADEARSAFASYEASSEEFLDGGAGPTSYEEGPRSPQGAR